MNKKCLAVAAAMCVAAGLCAAEVKSTKIEDVDRYMTYKEPDTENLIWFKPSIEENAPFKLIGFAWYGQDGEYFRLPKEPGVTLRDGVTYLAKHTAGGQVRFRTNSNRVVVRAKTRGFGVMNHMPQTGSGGFDLYVGDGTKQNFCGTTTYGLNETEFKSQLFGAGDGKTMHDFTLNFPLYNGVESVEIGIDKDAQLEQPLPFSDDRPVVIYGTSITQGGCASRPGMLFTNILSRRLNVPFINLGFSGNGCGDPELAELICQIPNPRLIILDYEANSLTLDMNTTLEPFMDILRKNLPDTPILIMTRVRFSEEATLKTNTMADERSNAAAVRFQHQKNEYDRWVKKGDKHIYFLDGGTLMGDDYADCFVDGIHPTDLGFYRMANTMEPVLKQIFEQEK